MKKGLLSVVLSIFSLSTLVCCRVDSSSVSEDVSNNGVTIDPINPLIKRCEVKGDYKKEENSDVVDVSLSNGLDIDLKTTTCYDKVDNSVVDRFVIGDILEVYYTDQSYDVIDHIEVDKIKIDEFVLYFNDVWPLTTVQYDLTSVIDSSIQYWVDNPDEDHLLYCIDENDKGINIPKKVNDGTRLFVTHKEYKKPAEKDDIRAFYFNSPR